jgi:NTE family protein
MLRSIAFLFLAVVVLGCSTKYRLPEIPQMIPVRSYPENIRLALVLGGGGARGMSHVGVLHEFEAAGIPVDLIVGCSIGSVVGSLYADCRNAAHVKQLLMPLKRWDILDVSVTNCRYGLVQGGALIRFLNQNLTCRRFEELQIPLIIVATDILAGELVSFNSGPIIPAVHASSAIPFLFSPVVLYDRLLVDGGVADPIPVSTAKKYGAAITVAVDLSCLSPDTCPTSLFGVAARSAEVKIQLQSRSCLQGADVVISPDLADVGLFDDHCHDRVYEAGRAAARTAIPQIKALLEEQGWSG